MVGLDEKLETNLKSGGTADIPAGGDLKVL